MLERSCTSCRTRRPKSDLLRFVRTPQGVLLDASGKAPGRGGYTCRKQSCLQDALKRGKLARTVRAGIPPAEASQLIEQAVGYLLQAESKLERKR